MSENVIVQYIGFEAEALVREYSFLVREASSDAREFTLTIVNEAFSSHRIRYQDAPDICSLKFHREPAVYANHPPKTRYRISETELDEYRDSHSPKAARNLYPPKAARELQPGRVFSYSRREDSLRRVRAGRVREIAQQELA